MKTSFFAALFGALFWCALSTTSSAQSLYANEFSDAASIAGWSPVADATNSAEAALDWNAEGALSLTGVNSADDAGRAYIFQFLDGAFDYQGATSVTLSFDLKTVGDLVGTAVHLQTELPGPGTVNTFDLQTQGLNSAGYTSYSYTFDNLTAGSLFRMSLNLAAGAFSGAGGTLLVDNLNLTNNGGGDSGDGGDTAPVATAPTSSPATPTRDAADVISVYGGAYTSIATNLNPFWGQSCSVDGNYDPGTGDVVLQYTNFNYQGTEVAATDASAMTHLHLDVWVAEGTDRLLKVTPVNPGDGTPEILVNVPLTPGSWNSVDLAKADFTGMTWTNVIQMKFDGQFNGDGSANGAGWDVYIDNLYFYNDGSGDTGGGDGGDTDPVATSPSDNAPAPTVDAANAIGLYGDAYTSIATNYDPNWGQSGHTLVNPNFDPGTGNLVLAYPNLNYQGMELATTDASAMGFLHVDVWVAEGTDRLLKVSPINNGSGAAEFLVNVPLTPGSWNSVDLPKSAFTGMSWDSVFQLKFDGQFNGDGSANSAGYDVYIDNLYFWKEADAPVSGCMDQSAVNYNSEATVDDGTCTFNVTFRVDMNAFTGAAYGGVFVNGTFNTWCGNCNPMSDADADGVWEVTLPLVAGTIEYKFTLDGWTQQEEFQPGGSCTVTNGGFTNRVLTIDGTEDLAAVCYNSCGSCAQTPGCMDQGAINYNDAAQIDDGSCLYAVTFQVDLSQFDLPAGATVFTNGTYNSWCGGCNPMTDAGDGLWTGTFNLPGGDQEYKFTINGWDISEQFDGSESCTTAPGEYVNRVVNISGATTLPVVCWNSCDACPAEGCTDDTACNYSADAGYDDGSCTYAAANLDCAGNCLNDTDADGICDEFEVVGCQDPAACNYDNTATDSGDCTYPPAAYFGCDGTCINDADGDGICDELEGLIPELETACGIGTMWDAELGQCVFNVECAGDINLDGAITSGDLLLMLANFGTYCPGNGPIDAGE